MFSPFVTVSPKNLSCCLRKVRPPFKLLLALRITFKELQGNRVSSLVKSGNSVFLSSFNRYLGVPTKFQQGSQASSHVEAWKSTLF